jgi:hypothetical protein
MGLAPNRCDANKENVMYTVTAKKKDDMKIVIPNPTLRLRFIGAGRKTYHEDKRRKGVRTEKNKEW